MSSRHQSSTLMVHTQHNDRVGTPHSTLNGSDVMTPAAVSNSQNGPPSVAATVASGHAAKQSKPSNPEGTDFRDLFLGRIDIIQYLNAPGAANSAGAHHGHHVALANGDPNSVDNLDLNAVVSGESSPNASLGLSALSTPQPLNCLTDVPPHQVSLLHQVLTGSASPASASVSPPSASTSSADKHSPSNNSDRPGTSATGISSHSGHGQSSSSHQQKNTRVGPDGNMYTTQGGASHLPESPPETDSGAGSANSPHSSTSTSAHSPYSPHFQQQYAAAAAAVAAASGGGVIHPPMLGSVNNPVLAQHTQHGVILGVHAIDSFGNLVPQQHQNVPRSIVHHHSTAGGGNDMSAAQSGASHFVTQQPAYVQVQTTPAAQISPPTTNSNASAQASPYMLPPQQQQHNPQMDPSLYGIEPMILSQQPLIQQQQQRMSTDGGGGSRKRMRSSDSNTPFSVKPEPTSPRDTDSAYNVDGYGQPNIKFNEWMRETWTPLYDCNGQQLPTMAIHVVANKGFTYSQFDQSFVNQKKNHTEVVVTIQKGEHLPPQYIRVENTLKPIYDFQLTFYGVKAEQPSARVTMKQSQTNRIPTTYNPKSIKDEKVFCTGEGVQCTFKAERLHFGETTQFNQRKNGRPNPDQKYFYLMAAIEAVTDYNEVYNVMMQASERVIVRASNPGQFENGDTGVQWQKAGADNSSGIYHPGPVMVNTDRALGTLTVNGDIVYTGNLCHPSDRRLKENIHDLDTSSALSRLQKIRIVHYELRPEVADEWGLTDEERRRVGVIAQELQEVMPDAVMHNGEFLQVDNTRLFYDTTAAVQEVLTLSEQMTVRVDEVEKKHEHILKLMRMKRLGSIRSISTVPSQVGGESGVCGSSLLGGSFMSLNSRRFGKKIGLGNDEEREALHTRTGHGSGGKCTHASCHREYGMCTNRWMQMTIIALVAIMAFCVVTMATLYTLDWYYRNHSPNRNGAYYGNNTNIHPTHILEPGKMSLPGLGLLLPEWDTRADAPPITQPTCLPTNSTACQQYCCPRDARYTYHMNADQEKHRNDASLQIVFQDHNGANPLGTEFKSLGGGEGMNGAEQAPADSPVAGDMHEAILRARRAASPTTIVLGPASIRLPELNMTIDERYCWGTSCDYLNNNYTFYIPVSSYMPYISVEMHFVLQSSEMGASHIGGAFVQYCASELLESCRTSDNKKMAVDHPFDDSTDEQGSDQNMQRFELPVGYFTRSIYKFRVGYGTELCAYAEDQVGRSFDQYTLVFYRVCDM